MKYVINEEELKDFAIKCVNDDGVGELSINVRIQDLIQSKTPVEEIASGEVELHRPYHTTLMIGGKTYNGIIRELIEEKYLHKDIKIYIEVIK